jgi:hypothetical protein
MMEGHILLKDAIVQLRPLCGPGQCDRLLCSYMILLRGKDAAVFDPPGPGRVPEPDATPDTGPLDEHDENSSTIADGQEAVDRAARGVLNEGIRAGCGWAFEESRRLFGTVERAMERLSP